MHISITKLHTPRPSIRFRDSEVGDAQNEKQKNQQIHDTSIRLVPQTFNISIGPLDYWYSLSGKIAMLYE